MERFVRLLLAGGSALVVGLWSTDLWALGTAPWLAGVAVTVLGSGVLLAGILTQLDL